MAYKTCCYLVAASFFLALPANAAILGSVEEFSSPGTNGWAGGALLSNPGTGGVNGSGDGYLSISRSIAANLGAHSNTELNYKGNWIEAGIGVVTFYLNDVATDEVFEFHLLLSDGQSGFGKTTYQYNTGFDPPNNSWQQYTVDFSDPADWTKTRGTASFESVLQNVDVLHFRHDLVPYISSPNSILGDLGIDHISLVPEPSTAILMAIGFSALSMTRCFVRRVTNG